jgi:riboflavin synthase
VAALDGAVASFHLMGETLGKTTLGDLAAGREVNIERALRLGDRLGGHLLSGHVDGVGTVVGLDRKDGQTDLRVEAPNGLWPYLVPKGSIAIDGVSLTVIDVEDGRFSVGLIPHTLEITTLGALRTGSRVNLEADMIGKWVRTLAQPHLRG